MANPKENIKEPLGASETDRESEKLSLTPAKSVTAQMIPIPRPKKAISEARIQLQGNWHNAWDVTVERGTILEDVLDTDYWKHIAVKLRPHDTIEVLAEDGSWYARLLVINADRLWARVFKLEYHDLTNSHEGMPKTQEEEYDITWTSMGKYALIKKGGQGLPSLKDGFQTKLEALTWLDGHLRTLNNG